MPEITFEILEYTTMLMKLEHRNAEMYHIYVINCIVISQRYLIKQQSIRDGTSQLARYYFLSVNL
jgi:hypothetical protein